MSASAPLIDFHAHILPGADHGSSGIEETLNQLAMMHHAGVTTVVATPHFYPNRHKLEDFLQTITSSAEKLTDRSPAFPRVCIGAEILYCDRLDEMEHLERLCIQGTDILLLELPLDVWNLELFDTVECLTKKYTVVLAHIDRYVRFQQEEISTLLNLGAYAQINTGALFSFTERRKLSPFLPSERLVALGSDLHNTNKKTYEKFAAARNRLGDELFEAIMERSARLLEHASSI